MSDRISKGHGVSRRSFLKTSAAVGLGVVASPAIVSNAFSSSGEVNFMGWAGYPDCQPRCFRPSRRRPASRSTSTSSPTRTSMFAQGKLSLQTGAVDVVEPTVDRVAGWASQRPRSQGWDTSKLSMDNYLPGLADGTAGEHGDGRRQAHDRAERLGHRGDRLSPRPTHRPNTARRASATCSIRNSKARSACARIPRSPPWAAVLDSPGQAAEAVARRLQGRSDDEASCGTSRSPRRSSTRPMSCSSGTARTRRRPPTGPMAPSSA